MAKTLQEAKEEVNKALSELLSTEIYVHNTMLTYTDVINLLIIDSLNKKYDAVDIDKIRKMYLNVKSIDKQLPNTFASAERKKLQLSKAFYIGYLKSLGINMEYSLDSIINPNKEEIIKGEKIERSKH